MRAHPWIIIGVAILVLGLAVGRTLVRPTVAPRSTSRAAVPAAVVGLGHAQLTTLPVTLQLTANIGALNEAVILPKTSGYLQEVTVRAGDGVRTGQVIAVIDHSQLDAQVAQVQAAVRAAEVGVEAARASEASAHAQYLNALAARESARAQLTNAQAVLGKSQAALVDAQVTYQRTVLLVQEGGVARQTLDDEQARLASAEGDVRAAQAQIHVAQAQIAQANAQVAAAEQQMTVAASQVQAAEAQVAGQVAALRNAKLNRQDATIVAPFTGMVVSRTLDPGAYVTPGTSTPILTVADLNTLDVIVNVAQTDLAAIHVGDPAQILVNTYPGRTFSAIVSRIAAGVDPQTRTVQVEIDIPNPDHALRPGMYATADLSAGSHRALLVPLSSLVTIGIQHFVWVVIDGMPTQREITVGQATRNAVEVTSGLSPEDVIVVSGTTLISEGQPVNGEPVTP